MRCVLIEFTQVFFNHFFLSLLVNEDAQEDILTNKEITRKARSEAGNDHVDVEDENIIYIARNNDGGIMTASMGSEDAYGVLERGFSMRSYRSTRAPSESSDVLIGGGGGSKAGSTIDIGRLELDSRPASPTKSSALGYGNGKSAGTKTKHLNDRLDQSRKTQRNQRSNSEADEPYAWISQTAPSSPMLGRSRDPSVSGEGDFDAGMASNSNISMEAIGDKFRKKLKVVKSKMEQPSMGHLPPVQRPRDKSEERKATGGIGAKLKSLSQSRSRQNSIKSAASIELPIFSDPDGRSLVEDFDDNADSNDEDDSEANRLDSPEQQTVLPKREPPRTSRKLQDLFEP